MAIGSPQWMYKSGEAYELDQSLKFNDDDSASLTRTPSSTSNRKTWTWSGWVKRGVGGFEDVFKAFVSVSNYDAIQFDSDGSLRLFGHPDTTNYTVDTTAVFRDSSAWYHFVVVLDTTESTASNRVKIYANGVLQAVSGTYPGLDGSLNFNNTAEHQLATSNFDGYLAEVNFIDGQALTPADFGETGRYGEWKPIEYSGTYGTNGFYLPFKQDYTVEGFSAVTYKGTGAANYIGGTGFKPDLLWIKNRTKSAEGHSLTDSVRGVGKNLKSNNTDAEETPSNHISALNTDGFTVGSEDSVGGNYNYVAWNWDMGADTPTGFSAVTYTGSNTAAGRKVGNVGFSPDLVWIKRTNSADSHNIEDSVRGGGKEMRADSTNAEQDLSGQFGVNSFDSDGFTLIGEGGRTNNAYDYIAWCWDMGNTTVANTSGSINTQVRANPTYGQSIVSYTGSSSASTVGHGLSSAPEVVITKRRDDTGNWGVYHTSNGATKYQLLNSTEAAGTTTAMWNDTAPTNSVFSIGTDNDTNGSSKDYIAYCFHSVSGYSKFGTYTGDATTNHSKSVTLGFRPAFLMVKKTSGTGNWVMVDNVRNPMSNDVDKYVKADTNDAEATQSGELFKFTSTGFTIGANLGDVNANGATYIYMAFAGGMDSISDYNTDGSIDSRVKANPTYGQSIVSYTANGTSGATVGHGLNSAPEFIIAKRRNSTEDWGVGHTSLGWTKFIRLNTTGAEATATSLWNDTAPSSTLVTLGDSGIANNSASTTMIMYCFHSVTGYSKFGSYTGNGNASGTSVTTGFEPAFVLVKGLSGDMTHKHWTIRDNTRSPNNDRTKGLHANKSEAEFDASNNAMAFSSTGFQLKGTDPGINENGIEYIYMAFADKREYAYWLDQSGNNNDWTSNNLTESDISVDSPSNNFATLNPNNPIFTGKTLSEGNLKVSGSTVNQVGANGTIYINSSGKWYAEVVMTENAGGQPMIGLNDGTNTLGNRGLIFYNDGRKGQNGGYVTYGSNTSWTTGDIMGIAYNGDDNGGECTFYKNGVSLGVAYTNLNTALGDTFTFTCQNNATGTTTFIWNFGQDSSFAGNKTAQGNQDGNDIGDFYYTPPTGFLALCTKNLPDATVTPSEHFNTVLWTGTTSVDRDITGIGFDPSLVWIKSRSDAYEQLWFDKVRGAGERLMSHNTNAESTNDSTLNAFITDGFTLGNGSSVDLSVNGNTSKTYVAWNWKANGSGSSNTNGSITSTVSANVDAGFSIVSYTGNGSAGQTIGHGLSKAPEMVIVKARSGNASHWIIYHKGIASDAETDYLYFNTNAAADYADYWNDTAPTNAVFTVDTDGSVNGSSINYIAYCFHSVDGYSKVGSYTGNGNADGTFVYTGFRPMWIMTKSTQRSEHWRIRDTVRDTDNPLNTHLEGSASGTEQTNASVDIDILSNGFKLRSSDSGVNHSGEKWIWIAFAETPFKYSNAR
jgi:hypothetical protein